MPVDKNYTPENSASEYSKMPHGIQSAPVKDKQEQNNDLETRNSQDKFDSGVSTMVHGIPAPSKGIPFYTPAGNSTQGQLNNPNMINVTIADPKTPLVILFGPPACGKTMTLVRLTRFLQSEGYTVAPIRNFRPSQDVNYSELCDKFNEIMHSNNAAESTNRISFMLVEIIKNGRRLCQILEAPGEHYFNPNKPNDEFPNYVNTIIASPNRKIWAIMIEPDWMDHQDRLNYVAKIKHLKKHMDTKDCTIFIYNKIDRTNFVKGLGKVIKGEAINDVKNLYPGIFEPFMNQNPITKFFKKYNCDLVPFQTGTYTQTINGTLTYQASHSKYCEKLWECIINEIKGNVL